MIGGVGEGVGDGVGVGLATGTLAFTSEVSIRYTLPSKVLNARPLVPHLTRWPGPPVTPMISTKPAGRNVLRSKALISTLKPSPLLNWLTRKNARPLATSIT